MRIALPLALTLAIIAIPATAQTTGIPGFNDYTINAAGSGSTSCTSLTVITPSTVTFQVTATPFTPVTLYVSFLPCVGTPPFITSCQGTLLHLPTSPLPIPMSSGLTDFTGTYTFSVSLPPVTPPLTVSTQAVLFCIPSFLPLFTQAYDLTLT